MFPPLLPPLNSLGMTSFKSSPLPSYQVLPPPYTGVKVEVPDRSLEKAQPTYFLQVIPGHCPSPSHWSAAWPALLLVEKGQVIFLKRLNTCFEC